MTPSVPSNVASRPQIASPFPPPKITSYHASTDVRNLSNLVRSRPHVPAYCPLEYLHHEGEHRAREGSVPTPFRGFITNKSMLCLNLQDLVIGPNHELPHEPGLTEKY